MSHLNERNLPMPYRNLGGTGLMVSALSFGCVCYRAALSRASQRRLRALSPSLSAACLLPCDAHALPLRLTRCDGGGLRCLW